MIIVSKKEQRHWGPRWSLKTYILARITPERSFRLDYLNIISKKEIRKETVVQPKTVICQGWQKDMLSKKKK